MEQVTELALLGKSLNRLFASVSAPSEFFTDGFAPWWWPSLKPIPFRETEKVLIGEVSSP